MVIFYIKKIKNLLPNSIKIIYLKIRNFKNYFFSILIRKVHYLKNKTIESKELNTGYIFIAFGKNYFKESIDAVKILKSYTKLPIHLFTDQKKISKKDRSLFYSISKASKLQLRSKVDYISQSPFDKTIYLDTDVIIMENIDDLFKLLDRYEFIATLDIARKRNYISELIPEYKKIPYAFGEINGGVLGFNKIAKEKVLSKWPKLFYKYSHLTKGWDQPSLRILLWKTKSSIYILPPEYNVRSKNLIKKMRNLKEELGIEHMNVKIYHMHVFKNIHKNEDYPKLSPKDIIKFAKENSYDITY